MIKCCTYRTGSVGTGGIIKHQAGSSQKRTGFVTTLYSVQFKYQKKTGSGSRLIKIKLLKISAIKFPKKRYGMPHLPRKK